MELSILVAKIIAVVYLSAAFGGFLNEGYCRRIKEDLYQNVALTYLTGFLAVVAGLLIVHYHNVWAADWTVLITVIGWLALLKGVSLIVFPGLMQRFSDLFMSGRGLRIFPYAALILGLIFGYFGFVRGL